MTGGASRRHSGAARIAPDGHAVGFAQIAEPTSEMLTCVDDRLHLEGVDLVALADRVPTPFFAYSAAQVRRNAQAMRAAFARLHPDSHFFYASKACSNLWILQVVKRMGFDVEVNSGGELTKALRAGFCRDQIVFNGVAKAESEIAAALHPPIEAIVVDSISELRRIAAVAHGAGVKARVSLRIDFETATHTHPSLQTSRGAKAGIDLGEAQAAFALAGGLTSVSVVGVHYHLGSQVTELAPYARAIDHVLSLLPWFEEALGYQLEHVNAGGGFAVRYFDASPAAGSSYFEAPHRLEAYAEALCLPLRQQRPDLALYVEPGRAIVGSAAVMVTRIEAEKTKHDFSGDARSPHRWLMLDAGFNTLLEHSSYGWYYRAVAVNRCSHRHDTHFRLGGPLCDGGDVYAGEPGSAFRHLPVESTVGDLLAFLDVGAYSLECMSSYNGRDQAAAYLIDQGVVTEILRRRTIEDQMIDEHDGRDRVHI